MTVPRKYNKTNSKSTKSESISREDFEKKLGEIDEIVQETSNSGKDMIKFALGVGAVVVIGVAFFAGRRRALRTKTVVSFIKAR